MHWSHKMLKEQRKISERFNLLWTVLRKSEGESKESFKGTLKEEIPEKERRKKISEKDRFILVKWLWYFKNNAVEYWNKLAGQGWQYGARFRASAKHKSFPEAWGDTAGVDKAHQGLTKQLLLLLASGSCKIKASEVHIALLQNLVTSEVANLIIARARHCIPVIFRSLGRT